MTVLFDEGGGSFTYRGRRYVAVDVEMWTVWRGACIDCESPFEFRTPTVERPRIPLTRCRPCRLLRKRAARAKRDAALLAKARAELKRSPRHA